MAKRMSGLRRDENINGIYFMLPFAVLTTIFVVVPVISAFLLSFREYSLLDGSPFTSGQWVGLRNYLDAFSNPTFLKAVKNTLFYAVTYVPLSLALALVLALICNAEKIKGKGFFRTAFYIPCITSVVAVSTIVMFIFKPDLGIIATAFKYFGWQQIEWFTKPDAAMYVIIIAAIWMQVGGTMVIFLAGLQSIDQTLYEAAAIDGASVFQRFWYITLPKLRAVALFNFIMGLIFALSVFDIAFIISGGNGGPADGTMTVVLHLYIYAFQFMKMGYACAVAFVLAVIIITATVLQNFMFRSSED